MQTRRAGDCAFCCGFARAPTWVHDPRGQQHRLHHGGQPGADADLRLTAFKQRITPVVEGKVVYVSADRLVDKTSPSPLPYYAVHVRVTPEALEKAGDLRLQAGMPAEVFIKATARTTLQYLFDPISSYLRRSMREP
jgi:membrane fusion protein, epimerase transport system